MKTIIAMTRAGHWNVRIWNQMEKDSGLREFYQRAGRDQSRWTKGQGVEWNRKLKFCCNLCQQCVDFGIITIRNSTCKQTYRVQEFPTPPWLRKVVPA